MDKFSQCTNRIKLNSKGIAFTTRGSGWSYGLVLSTRQYIQSRGRDLYIQH